MVDPVLLGLAFGAGLLSFFSPCALPLLPAYGLYYLGHNAHPGRSDLRQGALFALGSLIGLLSFFGALGIAIGLLGSGRLASVIPVLGLPVGAIFVALGVARLATDRLSFTPPLRMPRLPEGPGLYLFGVAYAIAALCCAFPLFLLPLAGVLMAETFWDAFLLITTYSLGMGTLLVVFAVGLVTSKEALTTGYRRILPHIRTLSGLVLIGAGAYLFIHDWLLCMM